MKHIPLLTLIILLLAPLAALRAAEPMYMSKRSEELKNLKWGMFICWSFSTFSGKEWTPGVKDLSLFKATDADTDQWARTAQEAGMGYILFLTKHHDGFCLWDTKTTVRKVTKAPLGRDVLAQLRKSCDKYGIKLALYFSEGEFKDNANYHPGGYTPEMKKTQLKELLTEYGPIEYIWFDHAQTDGGLSHKETLAWCKSFQPGCFIGYNHGDQEGADIRLGEMGKPGPLADRKAAGPYMRNAPSRNYRLAEFTYPILPKHNGGAMWFYSLPEHDNLCYPAEKLYKDYLGAVKYGNIFSIDVGPNYAGKLRSVDVATLRKVGEMIRTHAPEPADAAVQRPLPPTGLGFQKPVTTSSTQGSSDIVSAKEQHAVIGVDESRQKASHTMHPDAQWFGEPQMGLFLHWGLSIVKPYPDISWPMMPGRALAGKRITDPNERARIIREKDYNLNGRPPLVTPNEYWRQAKSFNPQHYDPEKWIVAAKEAGFTYAVLVTSHHEGFELWPSAFGGFNTKNYMGGRDLVKPFVDACHKHRLKAGLYYSPGNWHFNREYENFLYYGAGRANPEFSELDADLNPRTTVKTKEQIAEHRKAYGEAIRGQIEELLTRYGKIDLLWFDGCPPDLRTCITFERMRELQPGIVLNPRFTGSGDFTTYEGSIPPATKPESNWSEFCTTWAPSWTYTTGAFFSNAGILTGLAHARSLNMNYLLGIGPDKDGELHPDAYKNMNILGAWMKANGEATRGTHSLPDGEAASMYAVAKGNLRFLYVCPQFKEHGNQEVHQRDEDMLPLTDTTVTLSGISKPSAVTLFSDASPLEHTYNADTRTISVLVPAGNRTKLMDVVQVKLDAAAPSESRPRR